VYYWSESQLVQAVNFQVLYQFQQRKENISNLGQAQRS